MKKAGDEESITGTMSSVPGLKSFKRIEQMPDKALVSTLIAKVWFK